MRIVWGGLSLLILAGPLLAAEETDPPLWLTLAFVILALGTALWVLFKMLKLLWWILRSPFRARAAPPATAPTAASAPTSLAQLAERLAMSEVNLKAIKVSYHPFTIPKRGSGERRILAPNRDLKRLQRRILQRILEQLPVHEAVTGFEQGQSIVTNARAHSGKALVLRMDIQDFFPSTKAPKLRAYFKHLGWDDKAANQLVQWCTWNGVLPQGAPTSPRLSSVLNYKLDARLAGLAKKFNATYTRYADDLTFSFDHDTPALYGPVIRLCEKILAEEGYTLHKRRKLHVRRAHQQQLVTGLVVNREVNLPRATRRRLRAVAHRLRTGREADLSPSQLKGWEALRQMVVKQRYAP